MRFDEDEDRVVVTMPDGQEFGFTGSFLRHLVALGMGPEEEQFVRVSVSVEDHVLRLEQVAVVVPGEGGTLDWGDDDPCIPCADCGMCVAHGHCKCIVH